VDLIPLLRYSIPNTQVRGRDYIRHPDEKKRVDSKVSFHNTILLHLIVSPPGIISSLAFSPDRSGLYAAASLSSGIALFSEDTGAQILSSMDKEGATQVMFDRMDPNILYSTSRPSYSIQTWDVRFPTIPTRTYTRAAKTNQRLGFDLDFSAKWMAVGTADGKILVFDLHSPSEEPSFSYPIHQGKPKMA
jgi:WD40 repeat protein